MVGIRGYAAREKGSFAQVCFTRVCPFEWLLWENLLHLQKVCSYSSEKMLRQLHAQTPMSASSALPPLALQKCCTMDEWPVW